jgi:hypothetical protein
MQAEIGNDLLCILSDANLIFFIKQSSLRKMWFTETTERLNGG